MGNFDIVEFLRAGGSIQAYINLNPLNAELNPICHLLALLGVHHFLHVSRIRVKSLTLRLLSYIRGPSQKKCTERNTYRIEHQMYGKVL